MDVLSAIDQAEIWPLENATTLLPFLIEILLTFGMKIKDMVTVAGNIIHTLKAAYNCSY